MHRHRPRSRRRPNPGHADNESDTPDEPSLPPANRMRFPRARTIVLALLLLVLLLAAIHVVRWKALPVVGEQAHDGYERVSGVVHVHTTLSDGAATPDEVIAAARASGLKFVVITDHNNLDAKKWEG